MAFDADARILGVRIQSLANAGAYLSDNGPRVSTMAGARISGTVYDVPAMQLTVEVTFTNTVPVRAYSGTGQPALCILMARVLDKGSHALGHYHVTHRVLH